MKFKAEIKEVKFSKSVSNDAIYRVVLVTDDPKVVALGTLETSTVFDVEINPEP
jgi:hypothetical protein